MDMVAMAAIDHDRRSPDQLEFETEAVCDGPDQVERRIDAARLDPGQM